jgi:hypothetical protein
MSLVPTPARLKRVFQASMRVTYGIPLVACIVRMTLWRFTHLTGWHCKFGSNTEGGRNGGRKRGSGKGNSSAASATSSEEPRMVVMIKRAILLVCMMFVGSFVVVLSGVAKRWTAV